MQGDPSGGCLCPAYNAPAAIDVVPKMQCKGWPFNDFISFSFLYWHVSESGLDLATNGILDTANVLSFFPLELTTLFPSFEYKPAFKASIGVIGASEWVVFLDYTWLRGTTNVNQGAPSGSTLTAGTTTALSGTPVWVINDWFLQGTVNGQALAGGHIAGKWKYGIDLLDLMASRPFYEGISLTVEPSVGLRAAWIRQTMKVQLTESTSLFTAIPPQPIISHNTSRSWGLGPRLAVDGKALIPMGFYFTGNGAFSLLYTRYTKVLHQEDAAATAFNLGPYTTKWDDAGCLRPMGEAGLGFGWQSYLYCNNYHIDFTARYDFACFWQQNMMRSLLDNVLTGTGPSPASLYLHGLTVQGRFDF